MLTAAILQLLLVTGALEFDLQIVLVMVAFLLVSMWVLVVSSSSHRHGGLPRWVTRFGAARSVLSDGHFDRRDRTAVPLGFGGAARLRGTRPRNCAPGWLALPVWPLVLARRVFSRSPHPRAAGRA